MTSWTNVLFVSPDEYVRNVYSGALKQECMALVEVSTIREALTVLEYAHVDAVVFHLRPGDAEAEADCARLTGTGVPVIALCDCEDGDPRAIDWMWHTALAASLPNCCPAEMLAAVVHQIATGALACAWTGRSLRSDT